MADLTGKKVSETYDGLLKTSDNSAVSGTAKEITDGLGNGTGVFISTSGLTGKGAFEEPTTDGSWVRKKLGSVYSWVQSAASFSGSWNDITDKGDKDLSTNDFTNDYKNKLDAVNSIVSVATARALATTDNGKVLVVTADVNLTLNSTVFNSLPNEFSCVIRYDKSASGGLSISNVDTEEATGVTEVIDLSNGGSQYFFKLSNKLYQLN